MKMPSDLILWQKNTLKLDYICAHDLSKGKNPSFLSVSFGEFFSMKKKSMKKTPNTCM